MKISPRVLTLCCGTVLLGVLACSSFMAQNANFHNAPASERDTVNPDAGQAAAITAGRTLYSDNCAACHGDNAERQGNVPGLSTGATQSATDGELFWFITSGDVRNGMPAWKRLPEQQRWQLVTFLKSLGTGGSAASGNKPAAAVKGIDAAPPKAPFIDFRFEEPGKIHKITVQDLPKPFDTQSAGNGPRIVARPEGVWPQAPAGFKVQLYASGLVEPRLLRTAPNGDFFVAETRMGNVRVFRGITAEGKPEQSAVFASGLTGPFGIAFYPNGPNPQWVYIGNMNEVVRFPYKNGDLKATGEREHIADLPTQGWHTTRDIQFSPDNKTMFVSVGSGSNIDDPDTHPSEHERADILAFNPDGSGRRVYASGIRNPVGIAISPDTGELWCSVNERDALGDDLVPDYITHVQEGASYGWPWYYMGPHQDPRLAGTRPAMKDKIVVPDVLLQPHFASLEMTFYEGKQFPAEYKGDIFACEHGSWNRAVRAGYELIRVPLHQTGHASGEWEDFVTGFVLPDGNVWGRPVGVTVAADGSVLMSDDGSGSIWLIRYTGK